jgi:hypothetical protein
VTAARVAVSTTIVVFSCGVINGVCDDVVIASNIVVVNSNIVVGFSEDIVVISVVVVVDSNVEVYQVIFAIFIVFDVLIQNLRDTLLSYS